MSTLLKIDSSPMGERSISRKLTAKFAETWTRAHPNGTVISRDLTALNLPVVDAQWVGAAYTPEDARTAEQKQVLAISDSLISILGAEKPGDACWAKANSPSARTAQTKEPADRDDGRNTP